MAKYYAVYKCPLCGALLRSGEAQEVPYDRLPELCGRFMLDQRFAGNPYLHTASSHVPCKCADGSCGLASFAGFKRVERGSGG